MKKKLLAFIKMSNAIEKNNRIRTDWKQNKQNKHDKNWKNKENNKTKIKRTRSRKNK